MSKHLKEDHKKNDSWKYWLASIAINIVILAAVMYFTDAYYETNDDFTIAYRIADGYPYVGFVNYFLCSVLILINKIFTDVNVFMVSLVVTSFAAFTFILKTLMERSKDPADILISIAGVFFFSFDHYSSLQFTKTSALLMVAGLIFVADTYINSRSVIGFFAGFFMYFLGVAYRQKGMFAALSFICIFILIYLIINGKDYFKDKKAVKEIGLFILITVLLVAPYGVDMLSDAINAGTPERATAREYQALRAKITDYPVYKNYDKLKDEYESAGITKNDLYMIDRFILDYDGSASLENLKTITKIHYGGIGSEMTVEKAAKKFAKKTLKALHKFSFTGMHIILMAVLGIYLIYALKPKGWIYIVAFAILTVALYIGIYYMQRTKYRAFYVADVSAVFWIIYALVSTEHRAVRSKFLKGLVCVLVIASVACMTPKAVKKLNAKAANNKYLIEAEEHTEYFASHPDLFFVMPTTVQKQPATYLDPFAVPTMPDNVTNTGGWETLTQARMDFMKKYGVDNPIKDLIDNPDVLFFSKYKFDELTEYYNRWYGSEGKQIVFEKVDEAGDTGIYRVVTVDLQN